MNTKSSLDASGACECVLYIISPHLGGGARCRRCRFSRAVAYKSRSGGARSGVRTLSTAIPPDSVRHVIYMRVRACACSCHGIPGALEDWSHTATRLSKPPPFSPPGAHVVDTCGTCAHMCRTVGPCADTIHNHKRRESVCVGVNQRVGVCMLCERWRPCENLQLISCGHCC